MIEIVESVDISAPLEKVWRTFTDLTCWADWNSVLTGVDGGDNACIVGPGSFRCCVRPYGLPIFFEAVVEKVEPMRRIVWTGRKHGIRGWHEFIFEESGKATHLYSREIMRGLPVMLGGLFFPVKKFRRLTTVFLEELRRESEGEGRGG